MAQRRRGPDFLAGSLILGLPVVLVAVLSPHLCGVGLPGRFYIALVGMVLWNRFATQTRFKAISPVCYRGKAKSGIRVVLCWLRVVAG